MGKSKKFRNKEKSFAQKRRARENKWEEKAPRRPYEDITRQNAHFESYYRLQKICPEEEWDQFLSSIQENLPTAFRITGSKAEARALLHIVKGKFFKDCLLNPSREEGDEEAPELQPICLPWYPDGLGWQLQLTRKDIRRSEAYFRLHNFLISETNCGSISRQEVVSMIPPIVLDVKPHHKVLDMCAAPGSKTAQLIELLHAEEGKLPDGFVIANDVDNNRCYMLVHQAKRLSSPCIIITNHDAAVMPNLYVPGQGNSSRMLKFDRILCDVPCSGDGTLRKNPDIWLKWNTANGHHLHGIQSRIVRRGMEMLAVGGRLVYSTCSLNPLENEAVVHRLLRKTQGAVQLVDVSALLPGLKYTHGLSHWLLVSRDMVHYENYEDVPEKWQTQIRPQMFPPKPEEAENFHLNRCIRILPHQQDTGGFFVAVMEKLRPLPWESEATNNTESGYAEEKQEDKTSYEPQRKKRRIQGYKEDPFVFLTEDDPVWPSIRHFYEIDSRLKVSCLLTRCKEGKKKNIYFTSPAVRDIIVNNQEKIKLINTGVKTFVRCDNKIMSCNFRLAQEGLHSILPFMGPKRKVAVTKSDLIKLLLSDNPKCPTLMEALKLHTRKKFKEIDQGSCVLLYNEEADSSEAQEPSALSLAIVGWRGNKSVRAYVPVNDCVHYLRLCGADVSKYEKNKFIKTSKESLLDIKEECSCNNETTEDGDDINNETEENGNENGDKTIGDDINGITEENVNENGDKTIGDDINGVTEENVNENGDKAIGDDINGVTEENVNENGDKVDDSVENMNYEDGETEDDKHVVN